MGHCRETGSLPVLRDWPPRSPDGLAPYRDPRGKPPPAAEGASSVGDPGPRSKQTCTLVVGLTRGGPSASGDLGREPCLGPARPGFPASAAPDPLSSLLLIIPAGHAPDRRRTRPRRYPTGASRTISAGRPLAAGLLLPVPRSPSSAPTRPACQPRWPFTPGGSPGLPAQGGATATT